MNNSYFHKTFNFPQIPEDLIKQCLLVKSPEFTFGREHKIDPQTNSYILSDGSVQGPMFYELYELPTDVRTWIHNNIKPFHSCSVPIGVQVISGTDNYNVCAIPPHIDRVRGSRILHYFMNSGGDDVNTVWYQEPGYKLERTNDDLLWYFANDFNDFRVLDEVYRTKFPTRAWTLMRSNVPHGVINITGVRISISMAILDDEIKDFCTFHNITLEEFQLLEN